MKPRLDSQLSLGPLPLEKSSQASAPRTKDTQADEPRTTCEQADAATLIDAALTDARITSAEVAHLIGISESLVNRWRSPNYREAPSFTQMLRLPVTVHLSLHRALNKRFGFGRAALAQLLEAAGLLAVEQS